MKRAFSSLGLMFLFPLQLVKKLSKDNFVSGLIFGAIFSLVVNLITVQVQEEISKQRTLEAIENEINLNFLQAKNVKETNDKALEKHDPLNYYHRSVEYSSDLWSQSSDPIRYVAQLDSNTQSLILLYYSIIVKNSNNIVRRVNDVFNQQYVNCFTVNLEFKSSNKDCITIGDTIRGGENVVAELMRENSQLVLENFHPTKDRLNSWFLRLMMGDKSVRVLSGK
ncbi:hypothetical protein A2415_01175 [candidate division WWE3 bacterium RIFOXYC1_FULL_39_7]|uniref:Uncharacterized protein n=2 Tax=Katanobacteria TaxID=422282 RepID=A0A1F4X9V4_UNCKA|nr:MAG: hypothetical protein A2415_01175 [candidate division WWE3 bacterium RIFOXYC1_FULL_39_7]OGC78311.1 MAG: hypothetical protein A2619_04075 [candidate division WWE3 bacterium RIFOXYD1_FULL_39_9]